MTPAQVLVGVRAGLQAIQSGRFFDTERGYQGALLGQLDRHLKLPHYMIVEQEYQKKAGAHGLNIRPDIIIHEPFDPERYVNRAEGNIAVLELKRKATAAEAAADFASLGLMLDTLKYPLGIFINIADSRTWFETAPQAIRDRLVCFSVVLQGNDVVVEEVGAAFD